MTHTNAQTQAPDTQAVLTQYDSADLIMALATRYNQEAEDWDQLVSDNHRLEQQLDGYKRQANTQIEDIKALQEQIKTLEEENQFCRDMALKAEDIANKSVALQTANQTLKNQVSGLQREITSMKQMGDPKKLKATIGDKNAKLKDLEKRNNALQHKLNQAEHKQTQTQISLNQAIDKIATLKMTLAHDTGSGLYHNDKHHLIIWPQVTKMQGEDGTIFEGRSLLYMHQSGRGGLMTYNPGTNEVNLCAAPVGGLRPNEDTREFAKNWLFKVNALQNGNVQEEDMIAVNYNGTEG